MANSNWRDWMGCGLKCSACGSEKVTRSAGGWCFDCGDTTRPVAAEQREDRCTRCHVAGFMTDDCCTWCNEPVIAPELRGTQSATQCEQLPDHLVPELAKATYPMTPEQEALWGVPPGHARVDGRVYRLPRHEEANRAQVVELERAMAEARAEDWRRELEKAFSTERDGYEQRKLERMQLVTTMPGRVSFRIAEVVPPSVASCRECGASIVQLVDGMCADCRVPLDQRIQAAQQDHDTAEEWGAWESPTWEEP